MKRVDTEDGQYVIYHVSEAGMPQAHNTGRGEWFFEPGDPDYRSDGVYSDGYPTEEAAEQAARDWAAEQVAEWNADR